MLQKIKQEYTPYYLWECYKNNLYNVSYNKNDVSKCLEFMQNNNLFVESMHSVCFEWNYTMLNHLTNTNINRIAFLGQCGVCYSQKVPSILTKKCWKYLEPKNQIFLNNSANNIIKKWIQNRKLQITLMNGNQDVIKTEYQMKLNL